MEDMSFLGNPAFYHPNECTGKYEHFAEFSYTLRAYMTLIRPPATFASSRGSDRTLPKPCNTWCCMKYNMYAQKAVHSRKLWLLKQKLP